MMSYTRYKEYRENLFDLIGGRWFFDRKSSNLMTGTICKRHYSEAREMLGTTCRAILLMSKSYRLWYFMPCFQREKTGIKLPRQT